MTFIWFYIKEALMNLVGAKLRSFLAVLGILVGTGSVVALISSSELATMSALAQFKSLGTNLLSMSLSDNPNFPKSEQQPVLTIDDLQILRAASPQIVRVAGYTNLYQSLSYKGEDINGSVLGA